VKIKILPLAKVLWCVRVWSLPKSLRKFIKSRSQFRSSKAGSISRSFSTIDELYFFNSQLLIVFHYWVSSHHYYPRAKQIFKQMISFISIQVLLIIAKSILNKLEVFKSYLPELQVEVFCYSTSRATDLNLYVVINIFKL